VKVIKSIRSRSKGKATAIDMVIVVDSSMTTSEAHDIADAVERKLRKELQVEDATIHVEPDS
jgi:divalent metal cation (Fe/Co/Zn/Cd) transporter